LRALRIEEQRAVQQALAGTSTLLSESPRARDALLFAAAASVAKHPVLVASPLAAELVAHAAHLPGIDVAAFGSFVSTATVAASKRRVQQGGRLLVVVEPRLLFDEALRKFLAGVQLSLLGIAAAHACSEHAHELSPAYVSLREAVAALGLPVLASCTQTTERVVGQVASAIGATSSAIIASPAPERVQNAQVVGVRERKSALIAAILRYGAPGIVLTATPQEADGVFAELCARKVPCVRAHAAMAPAERAEALTQFAHPQQRAVLVTQSPHGNPSGLAGSAEAGLGLGSAPPRPDLRFVIHYQAPLSLEQHFEDTAWLPEGACSLVLADSSDTALVQALLAQQRLKPAAVEAVAQVIAQLPPEGQVSAETLALRAGTSRRSAERVLHALIDRNLVARDSAQIVRRVEAERLSSEARLISARFAALRAADNQRAERVAGYVTSRHQVAPEAAELADPARRVRL
jgi:superfamily II DNA helicase RecQ